MAVLVYSQPDLAERNRPELGQFPIDRRIATEAEVAFRRINEILVVIEGEVSYSVDTDDNGGIYITGYTWGNLDGNTNVSGTDAFLSKYDSTGTKLWTQLLGSSSIEHSWGVATDSEGGVYITGNTEGNLDGNTNKGGRDAFLAKYDSKGTKLWTKLLGTSSFDVSQDVTTDGVGGVYITDTPAVTLTD